MAKMSYEDWEEKYKPILNPLNKDAPFEGKMFETYGDEGEMVMAALPYKVWTLVGTDADQPVILPGYRFVNRIGYFITENPLSLMEIHDLEITIDD